MVVTTTSAAGTTGSGVVLSRLPVSISWRAVIAGTVFALGVAWIMYLLGGAIGFSLVDPYAQDPLNGLGYGAAVWILLTWLISLFLGGLLAGRVANVADRAYGLVHGILVWSVCIVLTIVLGVLGVTNLLQAGGQLIGSTASTAALTGAVSGGTSKKGSGGLDTTPRGINTLALEADIKQQVSQLTASSPTTGQTVNPGTVNRAINQLTNEQLLQIAGYLLQGDVDAAKNSLALYTDLSRDSIDQLSNNLNDRVQQYKQNIKDYADKLTSYTAGVLWVVLISNLLSLLAAIIGGWLGIHTVARVYKQELY